MPPATDAEIRRTLIDHLRGIHERHAETAFIEELGLCRGQVRVDVAVVNGSLHGYEIKSDRDTLRRLVAQVGLYSRVLDNATLVVGRRHVDEAVTTLPDWWEILGVDDSRHELQLRTLRRGYRNPARDARSLVELLWLDDAQALLHARDGLRGYRSRPRRDLWDRVCALYSVDEIADVVRDRLKARAAARSLRSHT